MIMRAYTVKTTLSDGTTRTWTAIAPSSIKLAFAIPKMLGFAPRSISVVAK